MVLNNNYDSYNLNLWSPEGILSVTLISSAFVMSIFFGIKLRLLKFRYRMKFPSVEEESTTSPPVLLRTHSMTDVRQGCSNGRYSYFEDNTAVSTSNYSPITSPQTTSTISTSPTTSSNVKPKKKEQESIFKWPFKSKLNLKKHHSFEMNRESYSGQSVGPQRRQQDYETMQKNERIKRSIYERLNSSASMPDLLQRDENVSEQTVAVKKPERMIERRFDEEEKHELRIQIHKGIEVTDESTQFVTVDEIKLPKRPIRVGKVRRAPDIPVHAVQVSSDEIKNIQEDVDVEEVTDETILKPPTPPIRRQSRSNSLRASQIEFLTQLPPLVMPRKNINQSFVSIDSVDETSLANEDEQQEQVQQLKSILKTGNEEVHKVHHITFINVPDSPSESDDERDRDEIEEDVWSKIDMHRNQLRRYQETSSESEEIIENDPPPLPKTPPPNTEEPIYLRDFIIA